MKTSLITVDRLANEGEGVGRLNGKVAFVGYSLPGEKLQAKCQEHKKSHSRWIPVSIEKASPHRVEPRCSSFFQPGQTAPWCGGCSWQHIAPSFQRSAKETVLKETLQRIGGLASPPLQPILATENVWEFRNKVQVPVRQQGKQIVGGFFAPSTHRIVELKQCPVQPKVSVGIVQFVLSYANENRWSGYQEDRHRGWLRHILVRTNRAGQAMVILVTREPHFRDKGPLISSLRSEIPSVVGIHQNIQPRRGNVILGPQWKKLWGDDVLTEKLEDRTFQYAAGSFFQVHTEAAELLFRDAINELKAEPTDFLLDLYCGVGCMTLLAASKVKYAWGIEEVPGAIKDAKTNAIRQNQKNVAFVQSKSESALSQPLFSWVKDEAKRVLVLLDPPRSGCEPALLRQLLRIGPKRIVYVSCNPATLARDLKILSSSYKPSRIRPVDMFPQTAHIETVATLEKL